MEDETSSNRNILVPELYFLISKFLADGPLRETAKVLAAELEHLNILPTRLDWKGEEHTQTLQELEKKYPHIGPQHLLEICSRIGPILDRDLVPSVPGINSLLGAGRQSLLRTKESISRPRNLIDYCTRLHQMPLADVVNRNNNHNLVQVLYGRNCSGPITRRLAIPTSFYSKQTLLRRTLGHLSAAYCVLFDRTGNYIITGADDLLVKLWSANDGRLITTFRGASAEITDIAVSLDNSMLAAGSLDRILRVWDLQSGSPIAVLSGHTGMITSVNFCPSPKPDLRYLVTTSTDGSVAFWEYNVNRSGKASFNPKPTSYHEKIRPGQAQMICASFSPGGIFLAAGSADHNVRIYYMSEDGPKRVLETEAHADTVDSIQWAQSGLRFISGSKDGTTLLWHFETQQWKSVRLKMSETLPSCPQPNIDETDKVRVTMVAWDYSDNWLVTAVSDFSIKIWNASTHRLHKVLRGHTHEIYVLEAHPKDANIILSADHDGQLNIWDIVSGEQVAHFVNKIEGQGHGGIYDAKWSPDGMMIAATDSHGHILMFGFGSGHERLKVLPKELFFHTDYRPLIRDSAHYVLDEQTQTPPHLMPPPFLVDVDGNPYPPSMQRLVPGRENCPTDQLVPNIAIGMEEVAAQNRDALNASSNINELIEQLANEQHLEAQQAAAAAAARNEMEEQMNMDAPRRSHNHSRRGVRVSMGNWQRDAHFKFHRRTYVRPINYANLQNLRITVHMAGQAELEIYRREMRKRPLMITTGNINSQLNSSQPRGRGRGRRRLRTTTEDARPPAYRTRAIRAENQAQETVHEQEQSTSTTTASSNSDDSTIVDEEELNFNGSSSSDIDSSDYSDWVANEPGQNLEPPKRSKRKRVQRRAFSPQEDSSDEPQPGPSTGRPGRKPKVKKIPLNSDGEIPDQFKPPEWLSEVIPRKAPYYPQMGDEIVYFRQGHQRYLDAVRMKNVYSLGPKCEPWSQMEIRDHELCKIIGIKYEIRPPRLCCLKLGLMNEEGELNGRSFTVKYHDMPDVLDFLVLKQTFDTSISRNWGPGDRFRCMIDDVWWTGQIEAHNELSPEFPESLFMCFKVRWDNGEYEYMSPWDLEPVDSTRMPAEVGGAVLVLPEELRATLYQPQTEEWPRGGREDTCLRIIAGLEQVMGLAIADLFLAPVDLNQYPEYAFVVEYPIDLSTIKARFENHFYRRITSSQFDVRYLATNAEKFNESHSNIVKNARIITDLCLKIIGDEDEVDVAGEYHALVNNYVSSESESEGRPGPSSRRPTGSRRSRRLVPEGDWQTECRDLLDIVWNSEDSEPFREPVDVIEHPDYQQIIRHPIDLRTIREEFENYQSPLDFCKDMRLIFQNSRNYNTNKRSRIYSMTLRLSTLFEAQIKPIIYTFKSARRRNKSSSNKRGQPKKDERSTRRPNGSNGPSTSTRNNHSDDDDDDDDMNGGGNNGYNGRTRTRRSQPSTSAATSNGVSSSNHVDNEEPGPSNRRGASRRQRILPSDHDESIDTTGTTSSTSSSGDSGDSEDELLAPPQRRGYESEESYAPNKRDQRRRRRRKGMKKQKRKRKQNSPAITSTRRRPGRRRTSDYQQTSSQNGPTRRSQYEEHSDPEQQNNKRPRRCTRRVHTEEEYHFDGQTDDEGATQRKRPRRYESDHSYHIENPNRSRLMSEDSDDSPPRPTRGSTRRAAAEWGKSEDSLEEPHDNEAGPSNSRPRRGRSRKMNSESDHEETSNITKRGSTTRMSRRSQTASDTDDRELGQPSTSNGRGRRSQNYTNETTVNQRVLRDAPTTAAHSTTNNRFGRRPANLRSQSSFSETTNATAGSSHSQSQTPPPHTVDHNYGEPVHRQTRTRKEVLSRHQRRPDQLDKRQSQTDDSEDDEPLVRPQANRRVLRSSQEEQPDKPNEESEDSDDDNTPLQVVATSSRNKRQQVVGAAVVNKANQNPSSKRKRAALQSSEEDSGEPGPSTRRARNTKRPQYNEDSEDESVNNRAKRTATNVQPQHHNNRTDSQISDDDDDEEYGENAISVSSRGRIRKISAKARGLFRE